MSSPSVGQLHILNEIFRQQYIKYKPVSLACFGICTGNGLEHIDPRITKLVYGIDVNTEYLQICNERYINHGYELHLIEADINEKYTLISTCDLIVANLFLEYVDIENFIKQIQLISHASTVLSVVIQVNNTRSFVSSTEYKSLESLTGFHHNIKPNKFVDEMKQRKFKLLFQDRYPLPTGKELLRLDFSV